MCICFLWESQNRSLLHSWLGCLGYKYYQKLRTQTLCASKLKSRCSSKHISFQNKSLSWILSMLERFTFNCLLSKKDLSTAQQRKFCPHEHHTWTQVQLKTNNLLLRHALACYLIHSIHNHSVSEGITGQWMISKALKWRITHFPPSILLKTRIWYSPGTLRR